MVTRNSSLCPAFAPSSTLKKLKVFLAADSDDPGTLLCISPCNNLVTVFLFAAMKPTCLLPTHSCNGKEGTTILAPLPKARPRGSRWHLLGVHNLKRPQVEDAFLPQVFIFPPSTLDFLSSLRYHRTVHPRLVMDDLFSLAKSKCFSKGIFWALK